MSREWKILWIMTFALHLVGCEEGTTVKVNGQEVGTSLSRPPEPAGEEPAQDTAPATATASDTDTVADTETGTGTDTATVDTVPATATESATDTATNMPAGPTAASVLVNGGATATNDLEATLTLAATDATEMYVTATSGCAEGGTWEAYATSKALTLPQSNAANTVSAKFRNVSAESDCVEDTIVHDDQAPAAPILAGTTPASPSSVATGVVVALTTVADVTGFELFLESTCTSAVGSGSASALSGQATIDVASNAVNTLYVRANDAAGNLSTCARLGTYEHDNIQPTVVSVDSDAVNDTYGPGEQLDLKLRFDSDVVVDDDDPSFSLTLTLETGTTDRAAIYQSVNADGELVFRYTPANGDASSDLDYLSTTAIILLHGTIRDAAGNDALLTLPTPGTAGSLASNKALVIDRLAPDAPTLDPTTVQAGVGNLRLRWAEGASDVTGYVVVRSASTAPTWTPTHGTAAALGATGTGDDEVVHASGELLLIDTDVANGTTYHYTVYAHDALYNYSTAATGSAAPKEAPVTFTQVEVGADFGCGLESHGKVYCWGGIVGATSPVAIATTGMGAGSKEFKQIAAGSAFVCGLATDGVVHCWGSDSVGQLGNGAGGDQTLPAPIATGAATDKTFVQVVAGAANACALAMSGGVYCWGAEYRAGINVAGDQHAPVAIDTANVVAPSLFRALHGRAQGACAIAVGGTTYCWGADEDGEIGNGGGNSLEPKPVPIAAQYFHQITAGETHGCGISTARALFCWGENGNSQLGDTGTTDTTTPGAVTVSAITTAGNSAAFKEVATGTGFTCALAVDGIVHCFGVNTNGRLGADLATTSTLSSPSGSGLARPADNLPYRYVDIDAATDHACAVTTGGKVHCWGSGAGGRLGNGASADAARPVPLDDASLTGDTGFLEIGKGGTNHGCGISTERRAYCWGANTSGQLGNGSSSGAAHLPFPVDLSNLGSTNRSFLSVTAGEAHSCGVSGSGDAFCWGSNTSGRLGTGNADTTAIAVRPEAVHTGNATLFTAAYSKKFVHVGTGTTHACGLAADANIYCWGSNAQGQLGTSSVATASTEPVRVDWSGAVGTPIQLTVGAHHSCALTDRGTAYCWGEDANDKLGDGAGTTNRSTPRLVTGTSKFVELTAGVQHTCALDGERSVYCWGDGSALQLGTTTTTDEPDPAAITAGFATTDVKFAHLSAGFEHTCGVTSKGGAYCWGTDGAGRLGIDSAQASLDVPSEDDVSPPAVGTTWSKLEVGCASRTCAITQSGKPYCWGSDAYGGLGNWTTTGDQDVPSAVSLLAL